MGIDIDIDMELGNKSNIGYLATDSPVGDFWSPGYWSPGYWSNGYWTEGTAVFSTLSLNKSEAKSVTITPTLYAAKGTDTVVDIYFQGGHSDVEDYGVGKHFTLTCTGATITNTAYNVTRVRATIAAGQTTKLITMTIVNNPTVELDRQIYIYSPMFGAPKVVTIVDTRVSAANTLDVINPGHGLTGLAMDGVTDDTANLTLIQNYLDTQGGGILLWPAGTSRILQEYLHKGVTHIGQGIGQTILKGISPTPITTTPGLSVGTKCRVTQTAHGLSTGDYVYFDNVSNSNWLTIENYLYYVVKVDNDSFDLIRWVGMASTYKVLTATKGVTTLIKSADHAFVAGDYIYFTGLTAPWDVLNGNAYRISSVKDADEFYIEYDSSGLASNGTWNSDSIWCGTTFDSSALPTFSGTANMKQQRTWTSVFVNPTMASSWELAPAAMIGLTVDGDGEEQGPFDAYQDEQASCIRATGTSSYQLHLRLEKMRVQNTNGNGLERAGYTTFKGYYLEGDRCWRAAFTTGGAGHVESLKNIVNTGTLSTPETQGTPAAGRQSNFHQEILAGGTSVIDNMTLDVGDVDISNNTTPATLTYSNIIGNNLRIYGTLATLSISDSTFNITDDNSHIVYGYHPTLTNVDFILSQVGATNDVNFRIYTHTAGTIAFDGCNFTAGNTFTGTRRDCIYSLPCISTIAATFNITDCYFGSGFYNGIECCGGVWNITDCTSDAGFVVKLGVLDGYPTNFTLINNVPGVGGRYCYITVSAYAAQITINHPINTGVYSTILTAAQAQYVVSGTNTNYKLMNFTGGRYITGTSDPTVANNGMLGDVYENTISHAKWTVSTIADAGYLNTDLVTYKDTVWTVV